MEWELGWSPVMTLQLCGPDTCLVHSFAHNGVSQQEVPSRGFYSILYAEANPDLQIEEFDGVWTRE